MFAQGIAATQGWRSPVAISESRACLGGIACWFAQDLKCISFLRPCHCALPIGDSVSLSHEQLQGMLALAKLFGAEQQAHLSYLQFGFSIAPLGVLTLFC